MDGQAQQLGDSVGQSNQLEIPNRVVAKIEQVLGIQRTDLDGYDMATLIEELCDTALMFEREEQGEVPAAPQPSPPPLRRTRHITEGSDGARPF